MSREKPLVLNFETLKVKREPAGAFLAVLKGTRSNFFSF